MAVDRERTDLSLYAAVARIGNVFTVFDSRSQDSGHISSGVRDASGRRWFVKTPGEDTPNSGGADRAARSRALQLSAEVSTAVEHPALISLDRIVDTEQGIVTVSAWFDGELLRAPAELRDGAVIESRTMVFNLGRMIEILLLERHPTHAARDVVQAVTREDPSERPGSMADFHNAWRAATGPTS